MKSCILIASNTSDADILAMQELARSRFDNASETIRTTHLSIMDIIDKIRTGEFRRVYLQSEIHLGRVTTEMIALAVCLADLGISLISQEGKTISDDYLMFQLQREILNQYKNASKESMSSE